MGLGLNINAGGTGPAPPVQWRSDDGALELEAPAGLLESIRADTSFAMNGPGHGGLEMGGVLLGKWQGGKVLIEDWRPVRCDHSRSASFLLSQRDIAALSCQIEGISVESREMGRTLLGWFVSHTRDPFEVRGEELELHERVFPPSAGLLAVVIPDRFGDIETVFHRVKELDGSAPFALRYPGSLHISPAPGLSWRPADQAALRTQGLSDQTPPDRDARSPFPWISALLLLVVWAASLALAWDLYRKVFEAGSRAAPAPPAPERKVEPLRLLSLHVAAKEGGLAIIWSPDADAVRDATAATLTVQDQGRVFTRSLSPADLRLGSIDYNRETPGVEVSLLVERRGDAPAIERAVYKGPPVTDDDSGGEARREGRKKKN